MNTEQVGTEVKTEMAQLVDALHAHTDSVMKKHVQVSYGLIVLVLVVVFAAGALVMHQSNTFNKELDKAQVTEDAYRADLKKAQDQIAADQKTIADASKQQETVVKVIHDRDQKSNQETAAITLPKSTNDVANDAKRVLGVEPEVTPNGKLALPPTTLQGMLAAQVIHNTLVEDLADTKKLLALEEQKTVTLEAEVEKQKTALNSANTSLEQYKHVAKKSKFHRILGGLAKAGEIAGTAVVAYLVGHAL